MTLFHGTIFLHAYGVWMKFLCCWKTGSRNSLLLNLRYCPLMYLESFHSRHLRWFDGTFLKKKGKKVFIVVCVSNFKSHLVHFRSVPPRYPGYTDTSQVTVNIWNPISCRLAFHPRVSLCAHWRNEKLWLCTPSTTVTEKRNLTATLPSFRPMANLK